MRISLILSFLSFLLIICDCNPGKAATDQSVKARMTLAYFNDGSGNRYLKAQLKARIEKKYQPLKGLSVDFFFLVPTDTLLLGSAVTTNEGIATFLLPPQFYTYADTMDTFIFVSSLKENPEYYVGNKELEVKEAILDIELVEEDSVKSVRAIVKEKIGNTTKVPSTELEIKFFVQRPFGQLVIGGGAQNADEEGATIVEFPNDLPGDSVGNVLLIVKVEDNDLYGSLEKDSVINFGLPTSYYAEVEKRSLWSAGANAPITLLILVNSLIVVVWGIMFYIVFQILRIRKV